MLMNLNTGPQSILLIPTNNGRKPLIPGHKQQPRILTTRQQIPDISLKSQTLTRYQLIVRDAHHFLSPPNNVVVL